MSLEQIRALQAAGDDAGALRALERLDPAGHQRPQAAALALALGRPRLAAAWAAGSDTPLHAAALLRLGERQAVLDLLEDQAQSVQSAPSESTPSARVAVLRARALGTLESAELARTLARREGDSPALIAAATLLGERLLPGNPRTALLALAEGLKVSEMLREETGAHLLAVLSAVQARVGGAGKASKTAQKALERSLPRSPARVIALLVLGRGQEAETERLGGELASDFQSFQNLLPE